MRVQGSTSVKVTLSRSLPSNTQSAKSRLCVCDLFRMWVPYIPYEHLIKALANCQGPTPTKVRRLKQCILEGMLRAAQHRIGRVTAWWTTWSTNWHYLLVVSPAIVCDGACMKSLGPHYLWHMSGRDRNKLMHALCGNTCLLVRLCLFLQLFVCCGLHIFSPVSPSPWRFAASLHDQLVSLTTVSQTRSFDFWHSLTNASSSSHVQSCVSLSVMVPSFVPRSSYAFSTASVCEHMAPPCVVPSTQRSGGLDFAPVALSHDPFMFADLAQICLCQKSPSSSVYLSMHNRLLCAGNLSQLDCQQSIFSKNVCLPAHVGSSFSFGVTLSVLPSTMVDSVLHVIAPVRSLLFLLLCGIVLSMCEASCNWFFRVWRLWFRRPQCKACRFVAGCSRNFAFRTRRHASSYGRFVGPIVALSFCFFLMAFHLCLLQQQQHAGANGVISYRWCPSRRQRNKFVHTTNGNTMNKCKWESSLESPGVELAHADELQMPSECMLSNLRADQVSHGSVGISFRNQL